MKLKYTGNGSTLKYNRERCTGCGACLAVCPHRVLAADGNKIKIAEPELCMECGACAMNCPFGSLEVKKGVGCAAAILHGLITGTEPSCG